MIVDKKAEGSTPKSEATSGSVRDSSSSPSGASAASAASAFPGVGGAAPNPFDFSAMSGLLNVCLVLSLLILND